MARLRPEVAASGGGLKLRDDENSRSVVMEIIKSLGRKIMSGSFMDIMRISRPASISYHMTYLQCVVRDFTFLPLLQKAAEANDPVTRLQYVVAFVVSGLHINPMVCKNKPPLNPVLGETYSASMPDCEEVPGGAAIYLEQTSHHPPITHWDLIGNMFRFSGHGQLLAGLSGPNTLYASKQGTHLIAFNDGTVIEYGAPNMEISGIMMGERIVNFVGKFTFIDKTNQIECVCEFVNKKGLIGSLTSWFGSKGSRPRDFFVATISQIGSDGSSTEIMKGEGSWLEFVQFAERPIWTIKDPVVVEWNPPEESERLPSDSTHRKDLKALKQGDIQLAQREKDSIENLQRHDKANRSRR